MQRTKNGFTLILFFAIVLGAMGWSALNYPAPATAAPMAVPTPLAYDGSTENPQRITWMSRRAVTADTRVCANLSRYGRVDVQYAIDQGSPVNTTTLRLQYTNDETNYVNGVSLAAANVADATDMVQAYTFGWQTCMQADVANTRTVTITVIGVPKD